MDNIVSIPFLLLDNFFLFSSKVCLWSLEFGFEVENIVLKLKFCFGIVHFSIFAFSEVHVIISIAQQWTEAKQSIFRIM